MALSSGSIHNEDFISYQAAQGLAVTYPDRWATFSSEDYLKFRKLNRIERRQPFVEKSVAYYAGGTLMQSISETSSPNKACIGGYWVSADYKSSVSWIRDAVFYRGNYYQLDWITDHADYYGIMACSVSGNKLFVITAKIYDGYNKTRFMYASTAYTEITLWVYAMGTPIDNQLTLTELDSYEVATGTIYDDEINIGFFANPLHFYLYRRNTTKALTKYILNGTTFAIDSYDTIYSFAGTDLDDGIDNIYQDVVSVKEAAACTLKQVNGYALDTFTDIDAPSGVSMFMFFDTAKQIYIYTTETYPYYFLRYKGLDHSIDDLVITDTDERIISSGDSPDVGNDQFAYAYNNKVLVFCFKRYTVIVDCTAAELSYKKYNYRFDAFRDSSTGTINHFSPLSLK